jgi:glutamate dehydrogenase/leucine dehydrogenase
MVQNRGRVSLAAMFEDLLREWDGEEAVVRFDRDSGAWMFVCVHSTVRGPAGGGTRMRVYAEPSDGLADAMRLSAAMSRKMAVADMPRGGGKGVLAVPALPDGDARRRLLLRYGDLVESLGGTYETAGDMNITPADLDVVAERCSRVFGTTGRGGNSGKGTARGVFHGIRASVEHVFGSPGLGGRTVLVQGVGSVGADLAGWLAEDGARVLVTDVDAELAGRVAGAAGAAVVAADAALTTECDVYAPCAVGGTLDAGSIPGLRCRIVAGCANNQLATPEDGDRLHEAGILYAPDYAINAGGVLQLLGMESLGWDDDELERRYAGIGDTLRTLYREADEAGITPAAAADRLAERRLSRAS